MKERPPQIPMRKMTAGLQDLKEDLIAFGKNAKELLTDPSMLASPGAFELDRRRQAAKGRPDPKEEREWKELQGPDFEPTPRNPTLPYNETASGARHRTKTSPYPFGPDNADPEVYGGHVRLVHEGEIGEGEDEERSNDAFMSVENYIAYKTDPKTVHEGHGLSLGDLKVARATLEDEIRALRKSPATKKTLLTTKTNLLRRLVQAENTIIERVNAEHDGMLAYLGQHEKGATPHIEVPFSKIPAHREVREPLPARHVATEKEEDDAAMERRIRQHISKNVTPYKKPALSADPEFVANLGRMMVDHTPVDKALIPKRDVSRKPIDRESASRPSRSADRAVEQSGERSIPAAKGSSMWQRLRSWIGGKAA